MYQFSFNLNIRNNSILRGQNAMPLKEPNSCADSGFVNDRRNYSQSFVNPKKCWSCQGQGRNSSDVSQKRRIQATGSSLNPSGGLFSFTSNDNKNTRIEALNRCRNQGHCVPPKVRAKQ
jgi:hypothetical protein